jgi:hypothetical protein
MVDLIPYQVPRMSCDSDLPKVTIDAQGRVESVEYPHAQKLRQFTYSADGTEIARVLVRDVATDTVRVYVRQHGNLWIVCNEIGKKLGEWRGDVTVETDGTYLIRAERRTGATKTSRFYA